MRFRVTRFEFLPWTGYVERGSWWISSVRPSHCHVRTSNRSRLHRPNSSFIIIPLHLKRLNIYLLIKRRKIAIPVAQSLPWEGIPCNRIEVFITAKALHSNLSLSQFNSFHLFTCLSITHLNNITPSAPMHSSGLFSWSFKTKIL